MNLKIKFLSIVLLSGSILGFSANSSFSKDMKKMDHKMDHKKMTMTKEMMEMAMTTAENNKSMMMMGSEMIKSGNTANDADKMISGAKMLQMGMMNMHMGMMHMKDMSKKDMQEMMSKMNMPKDGMEKMHKMMAENAMMLMNMGNKLMKEATKDSDDKKMMKGAELVHMGMMMHTMPMMDKNGMGKMMEICK